MEEGWGRVLVRRGAGGSRVVTTVVKDLSAEAGDMVSIRDPERTHMLRASKPECAAAEAHGPPRILEPVGLQEEKTPE